MQRVVRIRPAGGQGDQWVVDLADGRRFRLGAEHIPLLDLAEGGEVDEALEQRLTSLDERVRGREAALRLLRYRLRSHAELVARLRRRGFTANVIADVIADLTSQGLVDDARFARVWAENRMSAGQSGPHRVRAELRIKGVPPALIKETVKAIFGADREAELAATVAERHMRRMRGLPTEVRLRRLAGLLRRRGFSGSAIAPLLRRQARESATLDQSRISPIDND